MPPEAGVLIVVALVFGFINGRNDSANVVATVISTHALSPRRALLTAAVAEALGPFLFGTAVATTIGGEIIKARAITLPVVYAALLAAIVWTLITMQLGIPSSTSHALVGGLLGAVWAGYGINFIVPHGMIKILLALFLSPIIGLVAGYCIVKLSYYLARNATPHANVWFKTGEMLTSITLALSHGGNDAQKTMGIITLGLVAAGSLNTFAVPLWVVIVSAAAIGGGTMFGGWRIIHTLGGKFYHVRPVHGFGAQSASSLVILSAALLGGPVSTTHVVSSAIIGAGSADRPQKVRWQVFQNIIISWFVTIPAALLIGMLIYTLIRPVFG